MAMTSTPNETLAIPLGDLEAWEVRLGFGGGELTIGPAEPGMLVAGHFEGGVIQKSPASGKLELEPVDPGRAVLSGCRLRWDVGLTAEIPVDLRLDTGGNRSTIDLSALRIRRLELHTGASETHLRLPIAGQTSVRVECGFAQVAVEVPRGVAARIRGKVALGSTKVDETRFPASAGGWASPDYETAPNRVDIEVSGGFGSVLVS
ncbi:MAG: hypothetical protein WD830_08445 [Chloroflexota bacterium]